MKKKNEYIIYEDYAEFIIESPKYGRFSVKIDLQDIEKCKKYYWSVMRCYHHKELDFYVFKQAGGSLLLHRYLMDCFDSRLIVDHKDGDTFNNRRDNLRVCTRLENAKNRKMNRNNSSGIKGVAWNKTHENWVAHASYNGKKITIGNYECLDDAIEARKEFEDWYQGEFKREIVELL